jgi:hypothetical protein
MFHAACWAPSLLILVVGSFDEPTVDPETILGLRSLLRELGKPRNSGGE